MTPGRTALRGAPISRAVAAGLCFFLACETPPPPEARDEPRPAGDALAERLGATEGGRWLFRSLEAHGGWESWNRIAGLRYERVRTLVRPGGGEEVLSRAEVDTAGVRARFSLEGIGSGLDRRERDPASDEPASEGAGTLGGDALAEEAFLASLPFSLADPALASEHLGAEEDLAAGRVFERVRFTWPGRGDSASCVAWFDRTSAVLRRAYLRSPDGRAALVAFSDWTEAGGILVAARREIYRVERLYERPRTRGPRLEDRLARISPELLPAAGLAGAR